MSWLSRVRSGIPFLPKRQTPRTCGTSAASAGRWCSSRNGRRITASARAATTTAGSARPSASSNCSTPAYELLPAPEVREDPLKFRDTKRYTDRLKAARAATGERDALINARGTIDGHTAIVGVQDFAFMGGSMGMAVGAAFVAGVARRDRRPLPYIIFTAAGGARMQEGILSLMQMPRDHRRARRAARKPGLPYIVVLTDPTTGGVTASYAMLGDVQIAEPGALIGFAGQRVIEQTIREKLPEGFQRAEYLLEHGMIDMVVPRGELREKLAQLIAYLAPETEERRRDGRLRALDASGVQAQLDRLATLSPAGDRLGLERIRALLDRLGRPQDRLPPVFHVAGTNGKGSTVAFLRAALEARGLRSTPSPARTWSASTSASASPAG